jgi:hypothetical protein
VPAFAGIGAMQRPSGGQIMGIKEAPTEKGRQAARGLMESAAEDERKTEAETGKPLKKGEERFEERSKSSDGQSAGAKQR